jgi:opacity protein-like surface antigen
MFMFRTTLLAVLVSGALVTVTQAAEVQPNGYLFANIGQSDADVSRIGRSLDADFEEWATFLGLDGKTSLDDKDSAYKIGAGVQLNRHIGIEFQYLDLGEISYKASASNEFAVSASVRGSAATKGYGVNLVGTLPFDQFKLFGKVGYHKLKTDIKASGTLSVEGFQFTDSSKDDAREWVTSLGLGASYAFTPSVELVAEYERYRDVADDYNVDLASVGLRYNF